MFWPHWFSWGNLDGNYELINDLIKIRKALGIDAEAELIIDSAITTQGVLVTIKGKNNNEITLGIGMNIENNFKKFS